MKNNPKIISKEDFSKGRKGGKSFVLLQKQISLLIDVTDLFPLKRLAPFPRAVNRKSVPHQGFRSKCFWALLDSLQCTTEQFQFLFLFQYPASLWLVQNMFWSSFGQIWIIFGPFIRNFSRFLSGLVQFWPHLVLFWFNFGTF